MSERKPTTEETPGGQCSVTDGCPLCRLMWPASTRGKLITLAVLVCLAGAWVLLNRHSDSDVDRQLRLYDGLKAAGYDDEAERALGRVITEGERLYDRKQFEESIRVFEEVLKRAPEKPLVLNYMGLMVGGLGDEEKAIGYFTKAAEVDPLTPQPHWNLAMIYFKRKDYKACEERLVEAMKLGRTKAQYRLLWALCAEEQKLPDDVVVSRLHTVVSVAEAQVHAVKPEDLAADGSLASVWREAAKRLAKRGDEFGWERLKKLAAESPKSEVRTFAETLLAGRQKN